MNLLNLKIQKCFTKVNKQLHTKGILSKHFIIETVDKNYFDNMGNKKSKREKDNAVGLAIGH